MKPRRRQQSENTMAKKQRHSNSIFLMFLSAALLFADTASAFTFHHHPSTPVRTAFASSAFTRTTRRQARNKHLNLNDDDDEEFQAEKKITAGARLSHMSSRDESSSVPLPPKQHPSGFLATLAATLSILLLLSSPLPAHAGFGPSSGATTTPPPGLKSPETLLQGNNSLDSFKSNKKLSTAISSTLDERRLQEFNAQLDQIIEALREKNENNGGIVDLDNIDGGAVDTESQQLPSSKTTTTSITDKDTLEKARLLQTQIQSRQQLLDRLERQPYWFNYLAAFLGSISSTLVMHPVDTIKTRLMISANPDKNDADEELWTAASAAAANNNNDTEAVSVGNFILQPHGDDDGHHHVHATNSTLTMKTDTQHHHHATSPSSSINLQNVASLYQGLTGNLWKEGPPSAVYLGVYETVKYALAPKVAASYLLWVYLIAGAAGELVGSVIRAPAEATKSLVQSRVTSNALQAVQQVLFTDSGRATVVRAWQASVFRDVPFGAVQLATFEFIKAFILNNPNIDIDSSTLQAEAIIGAFAGGFGAFLTNPADVITTRIITAENSADELSADGSDEPLDVFGWAKKIYEEEGFGAFWVGWQARVGYWAPAISIFLTCYCSVRQAGIKNDWFP